MSPILVAKLKININFQPRRRSLVAWKPSDQFTKSIKSFAFYSSRRFGPVKNGWKNITEFRWRRVHRQSRRGQLLLIPRAPFRPPPPLIKHFFLFPFRPLPTTTVKNNVPTCGGQGGVYLKQAFYNIFSLLRIYLMRFLHEFLFSPQNYFKMNTTRNQSLNTDLTFSYNHCNVIK